MLSQCFIFKLACFYCCKSIGVLSIVYILLFLSHMFYKYSHSLGSLCSLLLSIRFFQFDQIHPFGSLKISSNDKIFLKEEKDELKVIYCFEDNYSLKFIYWLSLEPTYSASIKKLLLLILHNGNSYKKQQQLLTTNYITLEVQTFPLYVYVYMH